MNFNIWSLLFGVATVILVEGTRPQRSVTGQIRFCNEVDCDSPCQVEDLEFGKCKPILGFVAAGDRGSSIYFSGIKKKGDVQCQVYTRDDCKNKDDSFTSGEFDHPYWFGSEWDTAVAKSYKCRSK